MTRPKPKQNRLRQLSIKRIDLVDRGAAVDAHVTLFKRREPIEKGALTLQEVLAALPEDRRSVVEAALAEGARAVQAQAPAMPDAMHPPTEAEKKSPEVPPAPPPPEKKEPNPMADKTPEQIKQEEEQQKLTKRLEEERSEREKLEKKLADAEAESKRQAEAIAKMEDAALERECVAKAAEFPRGAVGLSKSETVSILKSLRQKKPITDDVAKKLEQHFAAVDELLAKSAVFKEIGSSYEGSDDSATAKLSVIAKKLQEKDASLNERAALAKAYEQNPSLYAQAMQEARR